MDVVLLSEDFFSLIFLSSSSFFYRLLLFSFVTRLLLPFFGLFFPLSWAGGLLLFIFLCHGRLGIHGREEYSSWIYTLIV